MRKIELIILLVCGLSICNLFTNRVLSEVVRQKVDYTAIELPDPFLNQSARDATLKEVYVPTEEIKDVHLPSLIIQGLLWGGEFPQAIINNKVMKIGDTIEEARITDINKNGVILLFAGKKFSLSISTSEKKE